MLLPMTRISYTRWDRQDHRPGADRYTAESIDMPALAFEVAAACTLHSLKTPSSQGLICLGFGANQITKFRDQYGERFPDLGRERFPVGKGLS